MSDYNDSYMVVLRRGQIMIAQEETVWELWRSALVRAAAFLDMTSVTPQSTECAGVLNHMANEIEDMLYRRPTTTEHTMSGNETR